MLKTASVVLVSVTLGLAACDSTTGPDGRGSNPEITELPRALSPAETQTLSAANRFGFELLAGLAEAEPGQNLFMSPLSAHMALGMALNGARAETLAEMQGALGFSSTTDLAEINASYSGLLDLLVDLDPRVTVEIANSVWYEQTFPFRQDYLATVASAFDAEVSGLDFASPSAPVSINDWVEGKTQGHIKKMVESLQPNEVMLLLNAIYFKGDWREQFDPDRTYDAPFTLADGSTTTVNMMAREDGELAVSRQASFQLVDLPYGGGAYRMTIVLPDPGVSLTSVIDGLDASTWASWTGGLAPTEVPVELPRFELEWEATLNDVLRDMGMDRAFQPGVADFGGMLSDGFDPQAPGTDLYITKVKQKSFVSVNEEGTEAAAATSVGIGVTSAPLPVRVDRPFLFAIRERLSGTVLFLGTVFDPGQS